MDSLTIELTAALITNYATPNARTKVETVLIDGSSRITIVDLAGVPRSVHRFVIHDATEVGCPPLDAEQSTLIFAAACSLITPCIFFSPLQPQRFIPKLNFGKIPTEIEVTDSPTGKIIGITEKIRITESVSTLLTTRVTFDENRIFEVVKKLLNMRPFDSSQRSVPELNILDALKRYWEAMLSGEPLGCYRSLFTCFEKTINCKSEKKGSDFDIFASGIIGLKIDEIKELREFNNRLKHIIRSKKDFKTLQQGELNLFRLAERLKIAADNVLLTRI
ncbi:hypothetical protein KAX97_13500 [candidate division WOR-3 bacterium]|nr:hypothetical protein [candidate division WOR-3 bacterium]